MCLFAACTVDEQPFSLASHRSEIVGGIRATPGVHESVGAIILITQDAAPTGRFFCSATLIAPDTILTAAHCSERLISPSFMGDFYFTLELDVSTFGQNTLQLPPNTYPISELVPHPDYWTRGIFMPWAGLADHRDIGLGFLSQPVTSVMPSVLMESDDAPFLRLGEPVDIAGYGYTTVAMQTQGIKHHGTSMINEVGASELQIGDMAPTPRMCAGDSGGPSFLEVSDGLIPSQRLIAVAARYYNYPPSCDVGGTHTRVDPYRQWIVDEMKRACNDGRRLGCVGSGAPAEPQPGPPAPPDSGIVDTGVVDTSVADTGIEDIAVIDTGIEAPDVATTFLDAFVDASNDAGLDSDPDTGTHVVFPDSQNVNDALGGAMKQTDGQTESACSCRATPVSSNRRYRFELMTLILVGFLFKRLP